MCACVCVSPCVHAYVCVSVCACVCLCVCAHDGHWFSPSSPGQQPRLYLGTCPKPSGLTLNLLNCKLQVQDSETGVSPSPGDILTLLVLGATGKAGSKGCLGHRSVGSSLSVMCSVSRPARTAFEMRGRSVFPIRERKSGARARPSGKRRSRAGLCRSA